MRVAIVRSIVVGLCAGTGASAWAGSCDVVYKAAIKSLQTPYHSFTTTTRNGQATASETISVGGVEYSKIGGAWKRSALTPQEMLETAQDNLANSPDDCAAPTASVVDGRPVQVFQVRSKESATRSQVRVSTSTGLLQGQSLTLPNGAQIEMRYDYGNVSAPTVGR